MTNGTGSGNPGDLEVAAGSIFLNEEGKLSTETASGYGGNIRLQVRDEIRYKVKFPLRHKALVMAAMLRLTSLIASPVLIKEMGAKLVPQQQVCLGSDSFASAAPLKVTLFTASSELGIDGTLEIISPDRRLEELSGEFADVEIAQGCEAVRAQDQSRFVVTGLGGLPPNPKEALSNDAVEVDLVRRTPEVEERSNLDVSAKLTRNALEQLVEAQRWIFGDNGEVVLTATAPTVTPRSSWYKPLECDAS